MPTLGGGLFQAERYIGMYGIMIEEEAHGNLKPAGAFVIHGAHL